jgi:CspA family cold shock protein
VLTFTPYSAKKKFKNLYISNEIVDDELKDVNKVLVRIPNTEIPITDLLLCFDGQNLFDENTSHFGSIFNLENLIQSAEVKQKSNVLVIATTSNRQRKIQYNPYPRDHSETSIQHLKEIHKTYIPEVVNNFNLEITHTKKHVLGASMGGLMAIKFSIINPEFKNVICLSPAFWYGFPGVLEDIKNIQKSTFLHLYTGYGFIAPEDGDKDVFVHITAVRNAGMNNLEEDQEVEFEIVEKNGKASAENLK